MSFCYLHGGIGSVLAVRIMRSHNASASLGENIQYKFNNGRFGLRQLDFDWHN